MNSEEQSVIRDALNTPINVGDFVIRFTNKINSIDKVEIVTKLGSDTLVQVNGGIYVESSNLVVITEQIVLTVSDEKREKLLRRYADKMSYVRPAQKQKQDEFTRWVVISVIVKIIGKLDLTMNYILVANGKSQKEVKANIRSQIDSIRNSMYSKYGFDAAVVIKGLKVDLGFFLKDRHYIRYGHCLDLDYLSAHTMRTLDLPLVTKMTEIPEQISCT